MSYVVKLSRAAEARFDDLTWELQSCVARHLNALGESPTSLGQLTATLPYPPGEMVYEFDCFDYDESVQHHFAAFFKYGQDEVTLIVTGLGHTEFDIRY